MKKSLICTLILTLMVTNVYATNVIDKVHEIYGEFPIERVTIQNKFRSANVGDVITFGNYEQNSIDEDGKEPIEWIVLFKSDENNSLILITKYIIDCYSFNGFNQNVTWENSSLRSHMNSDMMVEMFNDDELSCIAPTFSLNSENLFNGAYSGEATVDFLYIPSIEDIFMYLSNGYMELGARLEELLRPNEKRVCYATKYAIDKGVRVMGEGGKYPGAGNYFLRTRGLPGRRIWFGDVYADHFQSFVSEIGEVKPDGTGINSMDDGIRPMVQVKY